MNKKVRGLVISERPINESDKLLTILTENGKLKAVARGVKKPKSKLSSASRLFAWSNFVYHPGRSLATITEATLIEPFYDLSSDYEKTFYASYVLELADMVSLEEDNKDLLKLLVYYLHYLTKKDISVYLLTLAFQLKLLIILGIPPEIEITDYKKIYFSILDGIISSDFAPGKKLQYRLTHKELELILTLLKRPFNSVLNIDPNSLNLLSIKKLIKIFNIFIQETLSIFLNSYTVLEQLEDIKWTE